MKSKRFTIGLAIAAAAIGMVMQACQPGQQQAKSNPSVAITKVMPANVSPGMTARITTEKPVFDSKESPLIRIGDQNAKITNVFSGTEAEILIPNIKPGEVQIVVVEVNKDPGRGHTLAVSDAIAQRLVLSYENGKITLIDAQPRGGSYVEGAPPTGPRLSYDVLNDKGQLLFTGAIEHPTLGRMEVYDEPRPGDRTIRNEAHQRTAATFAMKVPNVRGATIRFYEAPQGVDLATQAGRDARVQLNEVKLAP